MPKAAARSWCPRRQVHDLRLKLATAGLPKGSVSGFELMDSARFGQTQFQERLTFQRGLEGELTRSISSLAAVQSARVHLALPNQNGFFREQQKPERLGAADAAPRPHARPRADRRHRPPGVVAACPSSSPKAVSVLDQSGALLTGSAEAQPRRRARRAAAAVRATRSRAATPSASSSCSSRSSAATTCAPRVTADDRLLADRGDLGRIQAQPGRRRQRLDPQPADHRAGRRRRRRARRAACPGARVEPAADRRRPRRSPAPRSRCRPRRAAGADGSGGRREAVTNYEVDKTVRVTRNASGTVKRLNAAVVVNNRSVTDAKGKTTQVPLAGDEIEKLTALVQREHRLQPGARRFGQGDQRAVHASSRRAERRRDAVVEAAPSCSTWCAPPPCRPALALVALLVFFGLVRPAVKAAARRRPARRRSPARASTPIVDDAAAVPAGAAPRRGAPASRSTGAQRARQGQPGRGRRHRARLGRRQRSRRRLGTLSSGARDGRTRPRERRHPADVARRGGRRRGVQAPVAEGGAEPRRDHRADEVDAARAARRAC